MTTKNKPDYRVRTMQKVGDKTFYHDLGVAWQKDERMISIKLYGAPLNGSLFIVPMNDATEEAAE